MPPTHASSQHTRAYLALAVGLVGMGFSGIFVKLAGTPGAVSAFYRVAVAVVLLAPLADNIPISVMLCSYCAGFTDQNAGAPESPRDATSPDFTCGFGAGGYVSVPLLATLIW